MRGIWQLAIASAVAGAVLVVSGFLLLENGGSNEKSSTPGTSPPPTANVSYGHARIKAKTLGGPYQRTVVVRVRSKSSGSPLHGAKVVIHGEMTSPHYMRLYDKKLQEVRRGQYKGPYTLIMPGTWKVVIVATSKKGDTSTSALPVRVTG
jgi:YtkA-like